MLFILPFQRGLGNIEGLKRHIRTRATEGFEMFTTLSQKIHRLHAVHSKINLQLQEYNYSGAHTYMFLYDFARELMVKIVASSMKADDKIIVLYLILYYYSIHIGYTSSIAARLITHQKKSTGPFKPVKERSLYGKGTIL